jgi:hypothetical protein
MPYLLANAGLALRLLYSVMPDLSCPHLSIFELMILAHCKKMRLCRSVWCNKSNWHGTFAAQIRFYGIGKIMKIVLRPATCRASAFGLL